MRLRVNHKCPSSGRWKGGLSGKQANGRASGGEADGRDGVWASRQGSGRVGQPGREGKGSTRLACKEEIVCCVSKAGVVVVGGRAEQMCGRLEGQ